MRLIDLFLHKSTLMAWLETEKGNRFVECVFFPTLYVGGSTKLLTKLHAQLYAYHLCRFVMKRTLQGMQEVLEITTTLPRFKSLIRYIELSTRYQVELYNVDTPLEDYYLFTHKLFVGAKVRCTFDPFGRIIDMQALDGEWDEYTLPTLHKATIQVESTEPLRKTFNSPVCKILYNDVELSGEEHTIIQLFVDLFEQDDPDMLLTYDGHLELPYLLGRIRNYFPAFSFSRFGRDSWQTGGHSYFQYGQIIYKQRGVSCKGRLHLKKSGVLYGEWNLWYPFELARICHIVLQRLNNRSVGYGISQRQLYIAMHKGFLIPYKASCVEKWRSGLGLFEADRGGLIYDPLVGFYTDVVEVDFTSLYPSIMVKKNISTETLFCKCCENRAPGLDFSICLRERGVMAEVLEQVILRREQYRRLGGEGNISRANALKGVLVTCFGYMGFKKSKFARIEAHQAIQAYARELLLAAAKISEELGFRVLHGLTDSLWVQKKGVTAADAQELLEEIQHRLGFDIKLEGIYRWIVFLSSTEHKELPVSNKFYGIFVDGEMKLRGLAVRRHDTAPLLKSLQYKALELLAPCTSYAEFRSKIKEVKSVLQLYVRFLASGRVDMQNLLVSNRISKTDYSASTAQAIVLEKLNAQGFSPQPGTFIQYVLVDKESTIVGQRYAPLNSAKRYDVAAYVELAQRVVDELFLPFAHGERQMKLWESQVVVEKMGKQREMSTEV